MKRITLVNPKSSSNNTNGAYVNSQKPKQSDSTIDTATPTHIEERMDRLFRALCKPNLQEMIAIWENYNAGVDVNDMISHAWSGTRELFFNNYNWTWKEFFDQRKEWLNRCDGR